MLMRWRFNTLLELNKAFGCPARPVGALEFVEFWNSLTEEERYYYEYQAVL